MEQAEINRILKTGEDYFKSSETDKAIDCFKKILDSHPHHVEALNNMGVIAFQQLDYDEASDYFQKALAINNASTEALENLAKCLTAKGDVAEAVKTLQKAFDVGIVNADLLNTMAQCFIQLEDFSSAKQVLNESLKLDPTQEDTDSLIKNITSLQSNTTIHKCVSRLGRRLNIGFVSIWFERGQAHVTKTLRDVLSKTHNTYVFARTGGVYNQPKMETTGFWKVSNLTTYPQYDIPPNILTRWIHDNRLDAVVFNEEYDWDLVRAVKATGVKVLTYLDYYKDEWKPFMRLYDAVLCSTWRTFHMVKDLCNAHYIGWGIDINLFRPQNNGTQKHTFFHNAGWLGINYRKMTPAAILAFDALSKRIDHITLFIHAQASLDKLPSDIVRIVQDNDRITYHIETVPAPGLYHKGRILLFPTKLEGLGLPLLEGLACGLPAIATDAPPMNEFIRDNENGKLVKIAETIERFDHIAFPETILDMEDLTAKMSVLADDPERIEWMSAKARAFAETALSMNVFDDRVNQIIEQLLIKSKETVNHQGLSTSWKNRETADDASINAHELSQKDFRDPDTITKEVEKIAASPHKIIIGPWLSEVGYEIFYWIPFLYWIQESFDIEKDRVTVISRGGCKPWYRDLSHQYIEIFDYFSQKEFKKKNEERWARRGIQKQKNIDAFDWEIIERVKSTLGDDGFELLHPSMMFNLFMPYWENHQGIDIILNHTLYKPFPRIDPDPFFQDLPQNYVAAKFYFNTNFQDTEENRKFVSDLLQHVSKRHTIILLDNGLDLDDHSDCIPKYIQNVFSLRHLMNAKNNLEIQTKIISNASAFIGTHGGFTGLARFYGVDAIGLYSKMYPLDSVHAPVFQSALSHFQTGSYTVLALQDLNLLRRIII